MVTVVNTTVTITSQTAFGPDWNSRKYKHYHHVTDSFWLTRSWLTQLTPDAKGCLTKRRVVWGTTPQWRSIRPPLTGIVQQPLVQWTQGMLVALVQWTQGMLVALVQWTQGMLVALVQWTQGMLVALVQWTQGMLVALVQWTQGMLVALIQWTQGMLVALQWERGKRKRKRERVKKGEKEIRREKERWLEFGF